MRTLAWLVAITITVIAGHADAYPQFQLARDQTCTGCHISPAGGGLLNENGTNVVEQLSYKSMSSAFMYGKIPTPGWLQLGGDLRGAAGMMYPGTVQGAGFPMQIDVAARADATHGISANVIVGFRSYNENASALHVIWPREHYLMWQQKPGENTGLYIRVGHFMPTYGLRLAEHTVYTQQFGGFQLYREAYAASASYVTTAFEVHGTGFIHDPYGAPAEKGDGGALYAEARLGSHAAVGLEGKYSKADEMTGAYGGVTGKLYISGADVLLLGEAEFIQQKFTTGMDDKVNQLAAYIMGTKPLPKNTQLDVGFGHFTQDTRVKGLYRDCIEADLHFYATSHAEFILNTRLEAYDAGKSPYGGYALAQLHYRL